MKLFYLLPLRNIFAKFKLNDSIHLIDKTELIEPLLQLLDEFVRSNIRCIMDVNYKDIVFILI